MSELKKYFLENEGRLIHKWIHYFDIYERHFEKFRNKELIILEIGVSQGGSIQMWKDYFGDHAKIYGIDIDPHCKELEEDRVEIFIGSQSDRKFLRNVKKIIPKVDILIDDGGHTMEQQIVTFEEMFNHVKENGIYLCEDLHTSYWIHFGGGYRRSGTFIEYSKHFIDRINAWHSRQRNFKVDEFTKTIKSLHYYDSILVIEKSHIQPPTHQKTGIPSFKVQKAKRTFPWKVRQAMLVLINKVLNFLRLPGFIWK